MANTALLGLIESRPRKSSERIIPVVQVRQGKDGLSYISVRYGRRVVPLDAIVGFRCNKIEVSQENAGLAHDLVVQDLEKGRLTAAVEYVQARVAAIENLKRKRAALLS